jgi:tRNA (adenine57-N1/adenine58-N1)-methyltransferase
VGGLSETLAERDLDAVVLDMLAPWDCIAAVEEALAPGGILVSYVATTTQLSRVVETMRVSGRWTEPRAEESLLRTWHLEGLAVRPDHRMNGHTGFLVTARLLAPGAQLPARRRRPAPGAYGSDYTGPGSDPVESLEGQEG